MLKCEQVVKFLFSNAATTPNTVSFKTVIYYVPDFQDFTLLLPKCFHKHFGELKLLSMCKQTAKDGCKGHVKVSRNSNSLNTFDKRMKGIIDFTWEMMVTLFKNDLRGLA